MIYQWIFEVFRTNLINNTGKYAADENQRLYFWARARPCLVLARRPTAEI